MTRINFPNRSAPERQTKPKRPSVQARRTAREDREYAKLRKAYLQENPICVLCQKTATQIHHVVRGANRRRGLLNTNTWIEVCSTECHEAVEALNFRMQICLKQNAIRETVERLRKELQWNQERFLRE
jgi:hypothetical protein